jgi:hypothetical protein
VRRRLRPCLFLSIPVRIGKPKHRTKNTGSRGASLRHGRKGRTPPGAKFAPPSTAVVRRRRGKTERESRLKTRCRGGRRRSPAGLRSVAVSSAKTEPPRAGQREREGRQGIAPPCRRGVAPSPATRRWCTGRRGSVGLPAATTGGQRVVWEESELGLVFFPPGGGVLYLPIPVEGRWIAIRRSTQSSAGACRPRAVLGRATKGRGGVYLPHSVLCAKKASGLQFFFTETVLIVSCSDFEQISHSFLCSNYSNENLFREFKSYRNFYEKV